MALKSQPLVSIIVPVYNAERFIEETIASVQAQTYENWELILVDDNSTDRSSEIAARLQEQDIRIKLLKNSKNMGVAKTRNIGLKHVRGSFLAYLDADDKWHEDKIRRQLDFMITNGYIFTFTSYDFVYASGLKTGVIAKAPRIVSFHDYLKNNIIWTTTTMFDLRSVLKSDLIMKDMTYGEDALAWLYILDKYGNAFGLSDILASYRRGSVSLSSNKMKVIAKKFNLYQKIEQISAMQGMYYFALSMIAATKKRL